MPLRRSSGMAEVPDPSQQPRDAAGMVQRLLCDEMLARLARWVRAAGHDVAVVRPGTADAVLRAQAASERRILVTRDRTLAAGTPGALWLVEDRLDRQAETLARTLALDWSAAPFTRCLIDNCPLVPASADEIAAMPTQSQALPGPYRSCPCCGRIYWPGSHVRRMLHRLEAWRSAAGG